MAFGRKKYNQFGIPENRDGFSGISGISDLFENPVERIRKLFTTSAGRARLGFVLSAIGIALAMLYLVPSNEEAGNVAVMCCALLAGVYCTRMMKLRRGEKDETEEKGNVTAGGQTGGRKAK